MTDEVTVRVHGLAVGGAAVGRVTLPEERAGMTAFVPLAAPGELVRGRVTRAKDRYLFAELKTIVEASPDRAVPPCDYFGECGGCDIQHLTDDAQRTAKLALVTGALAAGGLGDVTVEPLVTSPTLGYRRRISLHVVQGQLGYYRRGSRQLLPISACPVAHPVIEAFLLAKLALPDTVSGTLTLELGPDDRLFAVLRARRGPVPELVALFEAHTAGGRIELNERTIRRFGNHEAHPTLGAFSQVNGTINAALIERVLALTDGVQSACDLYAGAGNFAVPLATRGVQTVAVEAEAALVKAGRDAARRADVFERVTFLCTEVEKYVQRPPAPCDLLVADPPRAGLGPLTEHIGFAKTLALISCDVASAVRDLKNLRQHGWTIDRVTPLDMFPQTAHLELLSVLHRQAE